jgi:RNA polymerase sigma-70 factor (ECF subfamily)
MNARKDKEMELALDLPAQTSTKRTASPAPAEQCNDGELLQRIAGGDREAFDVIYRRFVRPVFALALRRLGDRGRAEDATQDAFASVWRSASSYRAERGPGAPWLYAVARNAIVDRARAQELPEQERPLLELAYWSGLSQSEIADFLNIPLGTVKTRTRSALGRLADALEELQ